MKFNLYLIKRTIPVLSKIISKVKFYPTKPNKKTKKSYIYFISFVSIQKTMSVQTVQIKNKYYAQTQNSYSTPYNHAQCVCLPLWKCNNRFQK